MSRPMSINSPEALDYVVAKHIIATLRICRGNRHIASKILKLGKRQLDQKLRFYSITSSSLTGQIKWDDPFSKENEFGFEVTRKPHEDESHIS